MNAPFNLVFLITLLLVMLSTGFLSAQTRAIETTSKKGVYRQGSMILSVRDLLEITQSNPVAYQEMKRAKSNHDMANVLGLIGGGLIGWPIGSVIAGGEPQWVLAGAGAVVLFFAIPLSNRYKNRSKSAVEIYNSGLAESKLNRPTFTLASTQNGIGLLISF